MAGFQSARQQPRTQFEKHLPPASLRTVTCGTLLHGGVVYTPQTPAAAAVLQDWAKRIDFHHQRQAAKANSSVGVQVNLWTVADVSYRFKPSTFSCGSRWTN